MPPRRHRRRAIRTSVALPRMRAQRHRCPYCDRPLTLDRHLSLDHIRPRSKGGTGKSNKVLAHDDCNIRKADRSPYPCEVLFGAVAYWRLREERPGTPRGEPATRLGFVAPPQLDD